MSVEENAKRSIEITKKHIKVNKYQLIAQAIHTDICDRRGLKSEMRQIDESVVNEILETWSEIAKQIMEN